MPVKLGSNISALRALRRVDQVTKTVGHAQERLASGLRINRASDDAAGMAISRQLDADSRVYTQGIRNINDGISAVNIADSALHELSGVLIRLRELAIQSANGTYSAKQRNALDTEGDALVSEYNRVIESTSAFGTKLLNGSLDELRLQGGYGIESSIAIRIGSSLGRNVNSGSLQSYSGVASLTDVEDVATGDFNGDGFLDIVASNEELGGVSLTTYLGDGQGNFSADNTYTGLQYVSSVHVEDVNNDGVDDLIAADRNFSTSKVVVFLGVGNGNFQAGTNYTTGNRPQEIAFADFNGDGYQDMAVTTQFSQNVEIFLNDMDGTFTTVGTINTGIENRGIDIADYNNDGILDLVTAGDTSNTIAVLTGTGGGGFTAPNTYVYSGSAEDVAFGDFNNDGHEDIVTAHATGIDVLYGNGVGGFDAYQTISTTTLGEELHIADISGDGIDDILTSHQSGTNLLSINISNGNTGFLTESTYALSDPRGITLGDVNEDGVFDLIIANQGPDEVGVMLGNATATNQIDYLDLRTRSGALDAMDTVDRLLESLQAERGNLGTLQSRLDTFSALLKANRQNIESARSLIEEANIAHETAVMIRGEILQQVGIAVLAQANLEPRLALALLP